MQPAMTVAAARLSDFRNYERAQLQLAPGLTVIHGPNGAGKTNLLEVGFEPGEEKRMRVDGAPVTALTSAPARPLVSVFLPDRLELVKGAPALRRAHLDQVLAALWPARAATRRAYCQALAQRNSLLARG